MRGGAPWGHRECAAMEPRAAAPSARRWDEAATRAAGGVRMRVRRPPAAPAGRGDGERGTDAAPAGYGCVPNRFFLFFFRFFAVCKGSRHTVN